MDFLNSIAEWFWFCLSLALPAFARPVDVRRLGRGWFWTLHLLFLAAMLVLLDFANRWAQLDRAVAAPVPILRYHWLPILFLLVYAITWAARGVWRMFTAEAAEGAFPEIDRAWERALDRLREAEIDLAATPVFLVVGRPRGGLSLLIDAAQLSPPVNESMDGVFFIAANRDGIYLCVDRLSMLGAQAAILAGEAVDLSLVEGAVATAAALDEDFHQTIGHGQLSGMGRPGTEDANLDATLGAQMAFKGPAAPGRLRLALDDGNATTRRARLAYFCRLLARDRRPYCPLNGVLIVAPLAATENDEDVTRAADLLQRDMTTISKTLGVVCPAFVMMADLEQAAGFPAFLQGFPKNKRMQRLGQRFPLRPELSPDAVPAMVGSGLKSLFDSLLRSLVNERLRLEPAPEEFSTVLAENDRLYSFMLDLHSRQPRVVRLLTRGLLQAPGEPFFLGGCYFAATSRGEDGFAFVAGIIRRLREEQNNVAWTSAALRAEAGHRGIATFLFIALVLLILAIVGLIVWMATT